MKKFICILISISLMVSILYYTNNLNKCRNFNYALNRYFTTGIFNRYKLYNIDNTQLYFSNGKVSFLKIDGISAKSPHERTNYTVFMQKNSYGIWKVEKVYFNDNGQNQ